MATVEIKNGIFNVGYLWIEPLGDDTFHIEYHNFSLIKLIDRIDIATYEDLLIFGFFNGKDLIGAVSFTYNRYKKVIPQIKEWASNYNNITIAQLK